MNLRRKYRLRTVPETSKLYLNRIAPFSLATLYFCAFSGANDQERVRRCATTKKPGPPATDAGWEWFRCSREAALCAGGHDHGFGSRATRRRQVRLDFVLILRFYCIWKIGWKVYLELAIQCSKRYFPIARNCTCPFLWPAATRPTFTEPERRTSNWTVSRRTFCCAR